MLNPKELLVLALIRERPRHGYDLVQLTKDKKFKYWVNVSVPYIYKILKGLVTKELIVPVAGKDDVDLPKTIYRLTEKGQESLEEGFRSKMLGKQTIYFDIDIALAIYRLGGDKGALRTNLLRKYEDLNKELEEVTTILKGNGKNSSDDQLYGLVMEHRLHFLRSEVKWLEYTVQRLFGSR